MSGNGFLTKLASSTKQQSFSRVGLMSLAECLASAAYRVIRDDKNEAERNDDASLQDDKIILLDALRFVIESSKQHVNPNYRLRGSLRVQVLEWVLGCGKKHCTANCSGPESEFLKRLHNFPGRFTTSLNKRKESGTYDDGDLEAWESEARRRARVLFHAVKEECTFSCSHGCLFKAKIMQERSTEYGINFRTRSEFGSLETMDKLNYADAATLYQKFTNTFLCFMEELVSFANLSCSVFSSSFSTVDDLPGSVKGKLGCPSQRRLPPSTTTAVLQAV